MPSEGRVCSVEGCFHSLDIDPAGMCSCHSWNRTYEQMSGNACAAEPEVRRTTVERAVARLVELDVPESALTPIRRWIEENR